MPPEPTPEVASEADVDGGVQEVVGYYDSGAIKEVAHLLDGRLHGAVTVHREDGSVESRSHFEEGALQGRAELFDEAGKLSQSADYVKGQLEGEVHVFARGKRIMTMEVHAGQQDGLTTTYDEAGRVTGRTLFVAGVQDGESMWYGPDGEVVRRSQYRGGVLHGDTFEYYPDGSVRQHTPYVDGVIEGEVVTYDPEGEVLAREVVSPATPAEGAGPAPEADPGSTAAAEESEERQGASFSGFFGRFKGG